jgi:single-stranded DNA-binding protein
MTTPTSLTLIGYLGKDREIRHTRERTTTKTVHNKVIDGDEEIEVRVPSRSYLKLSLASHERTAQGPVTRWHDLVLWRPERQPLMARKGDQVQVTGHFEDFQFETPEGDTICRRHFVVESFRVLRLKIRFEAA